MILVTGAYGLLGSWLCFRHQKDTIGLSHEELDITNPYDIDHAINLYKPDAVINCAGMVKNPKVSEYFAFEGTNGKAPHYIQEVCDTKGIKLVAVSTDCVFSGDRGNYTEEDAPDPQDNYGFYKMQGEITDNPHLTVRTSFVGWPDPSMRGLLAWLFVNSSPSLPGYINALWNGMTVVSLAEYLVELAYSRHTGIMHLYGQTISKYELLRTAAAAFPRYEKEVYPVDDPKIDRTLSSVRSDRPYLPGTSNFEEQMRTMAALEKEFHKWERGRE